MAWNHYPNWTPVIEASGFGVKQSVVTTIAPVRPVRPVRPVAREFAKGSDENLSLTGRAS
ncbi:hypothetical protein [Arthrobacter sp. efr-133-TYG-118]|uniref:hypothetical protein n=1 Tax=Arthrobacter sp. efr-133-TYG-118 TaxID=3040279 RepID=UPI00254F1436|nr:hypothetical protein [Arthrobacter sp. efr-133-TYG-118]